MSDDGCCTSCGGLGVGGPASGPETNGRCADCLGQGCAHDGPCADQEWCDECGAGTTIADVSAEQIGVEEQARPVVVTRLDCGHEIVTPGRWRSDRYECCASGSCEVCRPGRGWRS